MCTCVCVFCVTLNTWAPAAADRTQQSVFILSPVVACLLIRADIKWDPCRVPKEGQDFKRPFFFFRLSGILYSFLEFYSLILIEKSRNHVVCQEIKIKFLKDIRTFVNENITHWRGGCSDPIVQPLTDR